mmetsp:Transcript_53292/g.59597  ORF Transcript_53292/g.59597 Transcript_53292/m.59597 type:complete len:326 (+) Transcript_53292:254-1231(+)
MPDYQSSTDETSYLVGNRNPSVPEAWRINMNLLKAIGLLFPTVGLLLGFFLSFKFVFTPTPPVGFSSKEFDKTFIVKLFGFPHTCVFIDENPSKSPVAFIFIIGMMILIIWTFLDHVRINRDYAAGETRLKHVATFSKYTWLFRVFCFVLFPLCFVNSPTYDPDPYLDPADPTVTYKQLYDDHQGAWFKFILHYIPYLLWQLAVALQAIEQAFYHHNMGTMPFGISKTAIKIYSGGMSLLFVYYTLWIVTFLCGVPFIGHTVNEDPYVEHDWKENKNTQWGLFIMLLYDLLTVIIPLFLCLCRGFGIGCKKEAAWEITFSPSKKE